MRSRFVLAVAAVVAELIVGCAGRLPRTTSHSAPPTLATTGALSGALVLSGTPIQVTSALGAVWVLTCERNCSGRALHGSGQLIRVSASTGRIVQRIDVVDPTAFAIGGGAMWLTHFNTGTVSRVDPGTGHTTETVSLVLATPIVAGDRRFMPVDISAGDGSVWVSTARGWLAQIDPSSSRVVRMVRAPGDATGRVVVGSGSTWVADSSLGVGVVRAGSRRLKLLWIKSGPAGAVAVDQLAVGGGRVWAYGEIAAGASPKGGGVLTKTARLVTLDPRTGRIIHQQPFPAGAYGIAYGNGALFVAGYQNGQLFRVDAEYRIRPLPPVRGHGILITVTPGAIWVTTKSGLLLRIAIPTNTAATEATSAVFSQDPYMGVACHVANSVACDRVGLAVWLRRPAIAVSATIAGAPLKLNDPHWSGPIRDGRRTMFAGFLQPAGLTTRLHVIPESKTPVWLGNNAPTPLVRFRIDNGHGQIVVTQTNVWLSAGWG
jgi:hypothetical protein